MNEIAQTNIDSLNYAFSNIDFYTLNRITNLLENHNNVLYFSGIGKNGHIANIATSTFNSLSIRTVFVDPVDAVHGDLGLIEENSIVLIISKSGNTEELEAFCAALKNKSKSIQIILIHSNQNCILKKYSSIDLFVPFLDECDPWNKVPTCSLVCYLVLMHSIAMTITEKRKTKISEFLINHPGGNIGKAKYDSSLS